MLWVILWISVSPVETARQATDTLLSTLQGVLKTQLQERGPAGSIAVCRDTAQMLLQTIAHRYGGIYIRRVSTRWRNPADIPTPDEKALLDTLQSIWKRGEEVPTEWVDTLILERGRVLRYARVLYVQHLCLVCHGENLLPDVQHTLDHLYPHDRARGYRKGEIRGIVVVKIPLEREEKP